MNWEEIEAISELVGAIGVVVTLIYLAFQIRRNTKAIRLDTAHDIMEEIRSIYALMAEHDELAALVHKAATDHESIDGAEKVRWYALNMNFLRAVENAYIQWTEGVLDSRVWVGVKQQTMDYTRLPGFQEFWSNRRHWFAKSFQRFFEREIINPPKSAEVPMPGDY